MDFTEGAQHMLDAPIYARAGLMLHVASALVVAPGHGRHTFDNSVRGIATSWYAIHMDLRRRKLTSKDGVNQLRAMAMRP